MREFAAQGWGEHEAPRSGTRPRGLQRLPRFTVGAGTTNSWEPRIALPSLVNELDVREATHHRCNDDLLELEAGEPASYAHVAYQGSTSRRTGVCWDSLAAFS